MCVCVCVCVRSARTLSERLLLYNLTTWNMSERILFRIFVQYFENKRIYKKSPMHLFLFCQNIEN